MRVGWMIAAATMAACGGEVVVVGGGTTSDGPGGGGAGAEGGSDPTASGGGGAAPLCGRTDDRFDMALYAHDESEWGCTLGTKSDEGVFTTEGMVVYSDEATLTVDACPPDTDCDAFLATTVDFAAEGLVNLVPVGVFVRVEVAVSWPMGCEHYLTIQNLPEWEGVMSPLPTDQIWIAAGDGGLSGTPSLALAVQAEPLGCYPNEPAEDHRLRFQLGSETLTLAMGEEEDWFADGYGYRARNLRSFQSGALDDDYDWGFWVTTSPSFDQDF